MKVIDTSGWLHYFMNGPLVEVYETYLSKPEKLLVPTISLYEVFKKIALHLNKKEAANCVAYMEKGQILELSNHLAYEAAVLSLNHKLAMADAIIYATALKQNAQLITSDADFKGLPGVLFLDPEKK